MANYTYVDSAFVLIAVEAEAELALENGFSVSAEDSELLTLTFNNRAVMFAGVYLQDDSTYEVQVEEVINEDLDTYTVELNANGNVATLQEAGAVVRKAFEEMQDKLMQDNF
jgi:23S rRNA maturation-related 3'-5' exoribonuclease YhaM